MARLCLQAYLNRDEETTYIWRVIINGNSVIAAETSSYGHHHHKWYHQLWDEIYALYAVGFDVYVL